MLWLLRQWHVLRCQLTRGLMAGALVSGEASASHLSLDQEECKIIIFEEPQKIGTRKKLFCNIYALKSI
jgi:hypothetical protein